MEKWGTCQSGALVMPVMGDVGGCIAVQRSTFNLESPRVDHSNIQVQGPIPAQYLLQAN